MKASDTPVLLARSACQDSHQPSRICLTLAHCRLHRLFLGSQGSILCPIGIGCKEEEKAAYVRMELFRMAQY
jgi:hypothetical protein